MSSVFGIAFGYSINDQSVSCVVECYNKNMSKNHRSGKKMGKRHTTLIDAAVPVVDYLLKHSHVTKVLAGHITVRLKTAPHRLKIMEESGCLLLKVRGTASIQEIRVFSQNLEGVREDVEEEFQRLI